MRYAFYFRILHLIVFVGILLPLLVFAQSSRGTEITDLQKQIAERKSKIQQLEASIAKVKKDIDKKRLESISLKNQQSILENRIVQVELDIDVTQEKVDVVTLEIESLALEIDEKANQIQKQKTIIAELVRTLHYENDKDYIVVLAAYDRFSDFYNRQQYVERIERDLGKSAKALRLAKVTLEEKKMQAEERETSYQQLKQELDNKKQDLEEDVHVKDVLIEQAKSSERTFQTLLGSLRKQYQEIENEITGIEQQVRKRLEEQDRLKNITGDGAQLSWPTASRYITAYFHDKDYPYRNIFEHNAIDIRASQGTPVKAAAPGYVARAKRCATASCYSYVMVIHSGGISTVYAHLSNITAQEDQFVGRGDVVGYSGGTPGTIGAGPFTTGAHLHFEVRKNGIPVNPLDYVAKDY